MNKMVLAIFVVLSLLLTRCVIEPDRGSHGDEHEGHGDRDHRDR